MLGAASIIEVGLDYIAVICSKGANSTAKADRLKMLQVAWCRASSSSLSARCEEVLDNEGLQIVEANFSSFVSIDDPALVDRLLHVASDISRSGLELFVHGTVAVTQPLGDLNRLTDAVAVTVVRFDDLAE